MMVGDDPADPLAQSWARLRALGVTTVYPGHGPSGKLR
jgi:glyoxylase-like metal-dependent hydrolase (beta-lactamase superfamily II)